MHRFLHVHFNFWGPPRILDLEPVFSNLGDWIRYSNTGWILWTDIPVTNVRAALDEYIDENDFVLVVGVEKNQISGGLPLWIWEWLNSKMPNGFLVSERPGKISYSGPPARKEIS
jgi:hypothetical protein